MPRDPGSQLGLEERMEGQDRALQDVRWCLKTCFVVVTRQGVAAPSCGGGGAGCISSTGALSPGSLGVAPAVQRVTGLPAPDVAVPTSRRMSSVRPYHAYFATSPS